MQPALLALGATLLATTAMPQSAVEPAAAQNPVELGRIAWLRNFDRAIDTAKTKHLPVLLLFQEVPG